MKDYTFRFTQIIKAPDPRLKIQTKPVKKITPSLIQTLKEMIALAQSFKEPEGVGLASTQIGLDEAFFVAKDISTDKKDNQHFISVINPKIISTGQVTKKYFEGCLSTPNIWGEVKRFKTIKVSYQNEAGKQVTTSLGEVLAWIFQHEIDHLNGILFQDRVLEQKGKFYKFMGKDKAGTDIFEEITI